MPVVNDMVLVVEDDDGIQTLMKILLQRKQFSVETACDGETALGKLRGSNGKYSAILLDLMMPRVNGFEVLRALQAQPELLARTIVFTAASEQSLRGLDGDCVFRVIRKPFDIQAILGAVLDCTQQFRQSISETPH